jgi:hypothetical protein
MKIDYQVRIHKLNKYIGTRPDANYPYNEIQEQEYTYTYNQYDAATKVYTEYCVNSAKNISMPFAFQSNYTIQMLDSEQNGKRKILFQFNCSSI